MTLTSRLLLTVLSAAAVWVGAQIALGQSRPAERKVDPPPTAKEVMHLVTALEKDLATVRGAGEWKKELHIDELTALLSVPTERTGSADAKKFQVVSAAFDAFLKEAKHKAVTDRPAFLALHKEVDRYVAALPALNAGAGGAKKDEDGAAATLEWVRKNLPAGQPKTLRAAVEQSTKKDVITPVLMHTLERGLKGIPSSEKTDLDRTFDAVMARHPNMSKDQLKKLVSDWKAIPEKSKAKLVPESMLHLDATKPLTKVWLADQVKLYRPEMVAKAPPQPPKPSAVKKDTHETSMQLRQAIWLDQRDAGKAVAPGAKKPEYHDLTKLKLDQDALNTPYIDRVDPEAVGGHEVGAKKLVLVGSNFAPKAADNVIELVANIAEGSYAVVATPKPTTLSDDQSALMFDLPPGVGKGAYFIRVKRTVKGKSYTSNELPFYVKTPPPAAPVISGMSPKDPYPGQKVLISGSGFLTLKQSIWVQLSGRVPVLLRPMDKQPIQQLTSTVYFGDDGISHAPVGDQCVMAYATVLNDTQCELELPCDRTFPGHYRMAMYFASTNAKGWDVTKWYDFNVNGYKYKLSFTKLSCADTYAHPWVPAFPEGYFDLDGIFTQWIVIHDNDAYAKNTGVVFMTAPDYKYNSGIYSKHAVDSYTGTGAVYQPDNTAGDVQRVLAVGTSLYYYSGGSSGVKPDTQTIDGLVDLASVIGTAFGQPEVAAVAVAVGEVLKLLEGWLFSEDPKAPVVFQLGERSDATWTILELQAKTDNAEKRFTGTQRFLGPKTSKVVVDKADIFAKTTKSVPVQADYTAEYQVQRVK